MTGDDNRDGRIDAITRGTPRTQLDSTAPAGPVEGSSPVQSVDAARSSEAINTQTELTPTQAVASALRTGAIDEAQAQAQLIDAIVASQLEGLDPAMVDEVRAEVEALLADDPTLATLLKR